MEALISFILLLIIIGIVVFNITYKPDEHVIRKGSHSPCKIRFRFSDKAEERICRFTESCLYDENKLPFTDWNKLWGVSSLFVNKNSARIGWRCTNGEIRVSAYCYVNGERKTKNMGTVSIDKDIYTEIKITDDGYYIRIDNKEHFVANKTKTKFLFNCFPRFGGRARSPHKMKIILKKP